MEETPQKKVAPGKLHVQLLGGFTVSTDGVAIPEAQWKSRRASSLVKVLALAPDHRLHRDQLIDTLWPDSDRSAAANNFYQTLYTVRRILDPLSPGCLRLKESFLSLTAGEGQPLEVDAEQFEAAVIQAKDCQEAADEHAVEVYQAALGIYRGDLLPENLYEEWTIHRRAVLRQGYLSLLLDLARLYETRGENEPGIATLQRLLVADRSHEEAHTLLMRLYARSGQRQQALRQYQALVEALREELDTEPGQAAVQLYQAIQSGRLEGAPSALPAAFSSAEARQAAPAAFSSAEVRRTAAQSAAAPAIPGEAPLPTGTVTFLFTDIQGSTPVWEREPEAMRAAVARHHVLLREAIAANGGVVFKVIGDQFQAAFRYSYQGVLAAAAAQRALLSEPWPEKTGPIRVRMGLHTGPAEIEGAAGLPAATLPGDYAVSHTLNRAGRVMSAGFGGQILLSQDTAALARSDLAARRLPEGMSLRDLGEQVLKGLRLPEHLYQVITPGLPDNFPRLATARSHPNNLPAQLTAFIGRESQIPEVIRMVRENRLVTLTGAGGTGKTRLALQVAEALLGNFPGGVFLVELAPVSDPDLLPQVCAQTLELIEQPGIPLTDLLAHYLEKKQLLLVLDNCEHLLDACAALVARLAKACPRLHILTTSREILSVAGESPFRVPSLDFPRAGVLPPLAELAESEAVRLFVERTRQATPGFELNQTNAGAVVQICRRLDGIPLALELAAGRARAMAVEQIAARLDDVFRLLTGGSRAALPRQQTLKATIDWSYQLLTGKERALFQRLSVFAGGWSLEAAEADAAEAEAGKDGIAAGEVLDLLTQLVDKSLVYPIVQEGQVRYGMLEIIRQYAHDQLLANGGSQAARDRHLAYYARLNGEAEPHLRGKGQVEWLDRLDAELDNLRAALEWSRAGQVVLGLKIVADLMWYWHLRGLFREGAEWAKELLELERQERGGAAPDGERAVQRARALRSRANASTYILGFTIREFEALAQESVALLRQAGPAARRELGISLLYLEMARQNLVASSPERDEMLSIFTVEKEKFYLSEFLFNRSGALIGRGRFDEGLESAEASLAICREIEDLDGIASRNSLLGFYSLIAGDYRKAKAHFEEGLEYNQKVKNLWFGAQTKSWHILLAMAQGDYAEVNQLGETALAACEEIQYENGTANLLAVLIESAWSEGDNAKVMDYSRQIAGMKNGPYREQTTAIFLARRAILQDDLDQATGLLIKAVSLMRSTRVYALIWQHMLNGWIALWMKQGQAEPAARLLGALDWIYRRTAPGLSPRERSEHDAEEAAARADLGPEVFERAWKVGQDMTMEQALAFIEHEAKLA